MNTKKLMLLIAMVAVLAFTSNAFAASKIALTPTDATIATSGPNSSLALDAISSTAASNLKWIVVTSSPKVGHLDATTGAENRFQADGNPGTAIVIVQDEAGNMAFTRIVVVQSSLR